MCNDLLLIYQKDSYDKDLQFNHTSSEKGKRVNGMFTNEGIRGMLEGKNYRAIDKVFLFCHIYRHVLRGNKALNLNESVYLI